MGTMFGFAFGGLSYQGPTSIPNLEVPVECTLNELYNGCTKHVTYNRTVISEENEYFMIINRFSNLMERQLRLFKN